MLSTCIQLFDFEWIPHGSTATQNDITWTTANWHLDRRRESKHYIRTWIFNRTKWIQHAHMHPLTCHIRIISLEQILIQQRSNEGTKRKTPEKNKFNYNCSHYHTIILLQTDKVTNFENWKWNYVRTSNLNNVILSYLLRECSVLLFEIACMLFSFELGYFWFPFILTIRCQ